jgi:hypothetical protein
MDDHLIDQLFPRPADRPLRKPRFGQAPPPPAQALPAVGLRHDDRSRRPPFVLAWQDDRLGLRVSVEEGPDGELLAYVDSVQPGDVGKEVTVALVNGADGRLKRVTVTLVAGSGDCCGFATFGALDDIRREVGEPLTIAAYVLE